MSNESKIVLSNKQNGTTTEIVDSNSESNVSKKFLLPDESGKLLTEEKTNLMYLTKDTAESTYRKLEDSYSKTDTDSKLSEKLAVSRELLYIWYTEYLKTENLSDANNSRKKNGGVRKKVEAVNIETGNSILFESVAACANYIGCADSTISSYARSHKRYGKWLFKYME